MHGAPPRLPEVWNGQLPEAHDRLVAAARRPPTGPHSQAVDDSPPRAVQWLFWTQVISNALVFGCLLLLADRLPVDASFRWVLAVSQYSALTMLIVSLCLRHRTAWVRVSMRVISVLSMFSFPGGTLTGILQFVFFGKPGARLYYSARDLQQLTAIERAELVEWHECASGRWIVLLIKLSIALLGAMLLTGMIIGLFQGGPLGLGADKIDAVNNMIRIDDAIRTKTVLAGKYPATQPVANLVDALQTTDKTAGALRAIDPWGNPYKYELQSRTLWFGSAGPDQVWSYPLLSSYPKQLDDSDDIIVRDGKRWSK